MSLDRFNYSKWDNIELSDDESDLHPNIDKESWFRMKHRSRLEREEREDKEMREFDKANAEEQGRLNVVTSRLEALKSGKASGEDAELEDVEGLEAEARELSKKIEARKAKAKAYMDRRAWNIDNICKTAEDRTIVSTSAVSSSLRADDFAPTGATEKAFAENSASAAAAPVASAGAAASLPAPAAPSSSSSAPPAAPAAAAAPSPTPTAPTAPAAGPRPDSMSSPVASKQAAMSYNDYVLSHEALLEKYSEIHSLEDTKELLFKNCDVLMHEHSQSYMLLSSLEDEMNGKHKRMRLVCRQSQILSHIQELGVSMNRDPRDVILPFFNRISDPVYLKNFTGAVEDFIKRIQERAVVKRREMDRDAARERAQAANGGGAVVGPGGLDPYEVLETLPIAMQEAFESQDVQRLKDVLAAMEPREAKLHMDRCVKSGLWVANASGGADGEDDESVDGEEEESAAAAAP